MQHKDLLKSTTVIKFPQFNIQANIIENLCKSSFSATMWAGTRLKAIKDSSFMCKKLSIWLKTTSSSILIIKGKISDTWFLFVWPLQQLRCERAENPLEDKTFHGSVVAAELVRNRREWKAARRQTVFMLPSNYKPARHLELNLSSSQCCRAPCLTITRGSLPPSDTRIHTINIPSTSQSSASELGSSKCSIGQKWHSEGGEHTHADTNQWLLTDRHKWPGVELVVMDKCACRQSTHK